MSATPQRLVVVGNGMAAARLLELLSTQAPNAFELVVFGAEPHGSYNRIALSPLLSGEKALAEVISHPQAWYAARGIRLHVNEPVVELDIGRGRLRTNRGRSLGYDQLVLATGSRPQLPPLPGIWLPGVLSFRNLRDVQQMQDAARHHRRALIIGGGVLGLEAAAALARQGMQVSVVHRGAWLMDRQLDALAAQRLQASLEARGIAFRLAASTAALNGDDRVRSVTLADGSELAADLVVIAAGVVADTALARAAGLHCERGVVVDDWMQTSAAGVHAVGECIEHRGQCYGLVAPAYAQAAVLARRLLRVDEPGPGYSGSVTALKLKVTGIDMFSAGELRQQAGTDVLVLEDHARGQYRRLLLRNDRLIGVVMLGDLGDSAWYFDLLQSQRPLGAIREHLLFGRAWADAA